CPPMTRWFYTLDKQQRLGPVTSRQLRALAAAGTIRPESMVMREGGGKWVPAAKVKGLFPKPTAASPPSDTGAVACPGCGRAIPLQPHEIQLTVEIECARCGTHFVSSPAAHAPASSTQLDDAALLGLMKDAEPARQRNRPLDIAPAAPIALAIPVNQPPAKPWKIPPWTLVVVIVGGILLCCLIVAIVSRDSADGLFSAPAIKAEEGELYALYGRDVVAADKKYS